MIFPQNLAIKLEIGVSGGMFSVSGDVSAKLPTLGFGVHIRKAIGYVFSLRVQYCIWNRLKAKTGSHLMVMQMILRGLPIIIPLPWMPVYYNYRTHVKDLPYREFSR